MTAEDRSGRPGTAGPEGAVERTFEALPPVRGRAFAATSWGRSWLRALEDSALDGEQVRKGRRYAREGGVGALTLRPGRLTSVVSDPDGTRHRTDVLLRCFEEPEWDRLLDAAAGSAGHIAALLDREMPPELAEDAAAAGVDLLPGTGELEPRCDCGAWDHCPHTSALCHQVARLLDRDPFLLLLLRGRAEREVLDELQVRSARRAADTAPGHSGDGDGPAPAGGAPARCGVSAAEAFGTWGILPPLPPLPVLPDGPGQPPLLDTETEPEEDLDPGAVEFLAEAAAASAHELLARALAPDHADRPLPPPAGDTASTDANGENGTDGAPVPGRGAAFAEDAVRLASLAADVRVRSRLAAASGRDREALARAVLARRLGGPDGPVVLEDEWAPDPESAARARAVLAAAWEDGEGPALRQESNRWTAEDGTAQLRLDRRGRWWPFRREAGHWVPAGPPESGPAAALAALDPTEPGDREDGTDARD
ncbi:SWF or SNF family helicase [Streptomyces sp. NPDC097619]|uniref:SWF or SNF family helicase n=1 Tax=Streptomyces sp. NPDC097619 TaxID=3157228 RepID=UPI00332C53E4